MGSLNGAHVVASLLEVLATVAEHGAAGPPSADTVRRLGESLGQSLARQRDSEGVPIPDDGPAPADPVAVAALIRPLLSQLLPGSRMLPATPDTLAICLPPDTQSADAGPPINARLVAVAVGSLAGQHLGLARTRFDLRPVDAARCWVLTVQLAPQGAAAPDEDEYRLDGRTATATAEYPPPSQPDYHQERMYQLGEMAATVAHGLNNLLGAVAGQSSQMLDAAEQGGAEAEPVDGLRLIHQAALDGAGLARRLLRASRGEPAEGADALELVDLGRVLVDSIELTRLRWHDESSRLGIVIEPVVEIAQPLLVRGVAADLREIVVNLILNAVDAMPQGGHLRLRGDVQRGTVILSCHDTGVGMPPEVLDRVFEPFFTTKGRNGTGMGMAILYGVVARHGGEVHVSSWVDVGTTVTLHLPAAELTREAGLTPSGLSPLHRADLAADLAHDLRSLAVLVVEDDPVFRGVFTRRLSLDAHRVEAVGDATSALALLEAGGWDLVCVDEGLPDRSGRELATEIQRRGLGCGVILVTGSAIRPDDPMLASAGVDAVLPKPCTDAELARAVRAAVGRDSAGDLAATA